MKTIFALLAVASLASCQNGKVNVTPQQEAAGIAALSSVLSDLASHKKPKDTAIDAAQAALAVYATTSAKAVSPVTP
jgi:hypothetical protein